MHCQLFVVLVRMYVSHQPLCVDGANIFTAVNLKFCTGGPYNVTLVP